MSAHVHVAFDAGSARVLARRARRSRRVGVEEHLFACAECTARLRTVVDSEPRSAELLRGDFSFVLPAPFIRRIKEAGLRCASTTCSLAAA